MDRLQRDVILIRLIEALRNKGSWCGETHVQKATFFLQAMAGANTDFDFILYKHGPFSFDLRDELTAMRADGFVSLRVQGPQYGPSIVPEPGAEQLRRRFPRTLRENESRIAFVSSRLGNMSVSELERVATAYFVLQEDMESAVNERQLANRIHRLKPHISFDEAVDALASVKKWKREAASFSQ
jgi:uncharacterized protein YwgA